MTASRGLVSCCIPALDAARFITETIDSIRAQTYRHLEIVVVDDGSSDGTADVVRAHDPDVVVVEEGHGGLALARDRAVAAATGEWIACSDADDVWLPQRLERQLEVFDADPATDVCVAAYRNFWDAEAAHEAERYDDHPLGGPVTGWIVPTSLARRDVFDRFGTFSGQAPASDTGWFARAVDAGMVVTTLDEVLVRRRIHATNDSRRPGPDLEGLFDLIKVRNDARRRTER